MFHFKEKSNNSGYAALTVTLLTVIVSLTIIGGFTFFSLKEVNINRIFTKSIEAGYVSEGGVEDVTYRIVTGKQVGSSETLVVGQGSTNLSVTTNGNQKIIRSEGKRDNFQKNIETRVDVIQTIISFNYGAQVGSGGVEMSNNSKVQGSVYSNGSIIGPSSGSNAEITGNAFAAGTSAIEHIIVGGNTQAHSIEDVVALNGTATSTTDIIGGHYKYAYAGNQIVGAPAVDLDAHANTIIDALVTRDCYFQTFIGDLCLGNMFPNSPPTVSDLPVISLPISDSQINQWKSDAAAGGIINGDYDVTSNVSLGPKKITGDLDMDSNNKTLTVTGVIYVQGDIDIDNGSTIKCDASFGSSSCIILADGWIHLKNNGQFSGSGTSGSYLVLLSTLACTGSAGSGCGHHNGAIDLHNNATGAIFYAGNGLVYLHNNVTATDLVANKIHLENGAKIIYETGLQNVNFGGGGSYDVKYWREVE